MPDPQWRDMTFGQRIRHERKRLGYTQEDLSFIAGMSRQRCSAIETGRIELKTTDALDLCRALGITLEDLLGDTAPHHPVVHTF